MTCSRHMWTSENPNENSQRSRKDPAIFTCDRISLSVCSQLAWLAASSDKVTKRRANARMDCRKSSCRYVEPQLGIMDIYLQSAEVNNG